MSERALKGVLALVALVLLGYGAVTFVDRFAGGGPEDPVSRFLRGVRPESVRNLRIAAPAETLRFVRRSGGWEVNGYPADSSAVSRLLEMMETAEVDALVSRNPRNHPAMGVTADSARALTVEPTSGEGRLLYVGRRGPVSRSAFARVEGADEVYLLRGFRRDALTRDLDRWRDKTLVRVDSSEVGSVGFRRDERRYRLVRAEAGWEVDGAPADSGAVVSLLEALRETRGFAFAPDTVQVESPQRELVVRTRRGDTLVSLRLQQRREGGAYDVARSGSEEVWKLGSTDADRLVPTWTSLGRDAEGGG